MKEDKSGLIYVLADYKQLVLRYKAQLTQQAKEVFFWRTAAVWCVILVFCLGAAMYFLLADARREFAENKNSIGQLHSKFAEVTLQLDRAEEDLKAAKEELRYKGEAISRLEQGISSASKKLVENLLRLR